MPTQTIDMTTLPKAEHHVHIEAAISTHTARRLAKRNGMRLPDHVFANETQFACEDFTSLHGIYDIVASVLKTQQDYFDLVYTYLIDSAKQNTLYTEITLSWDHAKANQVSYDDMLAGCVAAMEKAKQETGIESRIIMILIRHFGAKNALEVAKLVTNNLHPLITGIGMAGDEAIGTVKDFVPAFEHAHTAGLHCTVHAGEMGSVQSVRDCLALLPIERIGHGVASVKDPTVIQTLIDRDILLEVCPTSNLFTKAYQNYAEHPLHELIKLGVKVSLNSDDPSFFNTTVAHEYQIAHEHFSLDRQQLLKITTDAIQAGFMDDNTKVELLKKRAPCI